MSIRPYRDIQRRKSRQIMVGNVPVGGDVNFCSNHDEYIDE